MRSTSERTLPTWLLIAAILIMFAATVGAVETDLSTYQMPPASLADLVDAPSSPRTSVSPNREWILLMYQPGLPSIAEVAAPEERMAGLRINPRNFGPSRARYYNDLKLKSIPDGEARSVSGLGDNPLIGSVTWSPDSKKIAFTLSFPERIELWVVDVKSAEARRLSPLALNDAYGRAFRWLSDSKTLILNTVPTGRGEMPTRPSVPSGPNVQENLGRKAPARTYQDLLKTADDERLFEYLVSTQLVRVTLEGESTPLGDPAVINSVSPSPDAKYLLVKTIHRPYSFTVPVRRFPLRIEVWDTDGAVVHVVDDLPLAEDVPIPFGSVRTGPRSVGWRADVGATLYWSEALDGGDAGAEAEFRDQVYLHEAPFDKAPTPLIKLTQRFDDISWGTGDLALVNEYWWKTRNQKMWWVTPDDPNREPQLMEDRSWQDRYGDPGTPLMTYSKYGTRVLLTSDDGQKLFLVGNGASPEGDRPFLDSWDIGTLETKRLFHSEPPYYEKPAAILDTEGPVVLTRRESVSEPPNLFLRDLASDNMTQLTSFPHPTLALAEVQKELVKYTRADGVELSATLYLPSGYKPEDGTLPMLLWAYPEEFKNKADASQVKGSPYRFVRVGWWSPLLWLAHGYAVLDHPTMPVVAEGDEEPNDTFVEQLVTSAEAAIDEMVSRGVGDADRMAIGGHSYGAFMTANLLAHSDLFRAGIARSGAYNRSLTPFGFQSEERTLWDSPEIYFAMSPFMHAEKVNEPILLIHGEADNNSGTYPLQSERYYGALKGHGATARLVMLPHESHGYRARESVMHMIWEMTQWLDNYVRDAEPREHMKTKSEAGGDEE
jgi:dipeptidyl aminopeptidase/acylaminoacyl peptidase